MDKKSKIYVAGHRGLTGSAIWTNLCNKGYSNLVGRTHKDLDLTDEVQTINFFEQERPEYVILSAAHVGGIMANNIYRADFILKNLQIQNNVIAQSFKYGVKKLLFLGSTCVYPKNAEQPIAENSLLTSPLEYTNEPYAIAKIAGLKMCESFNIQYGTNFIAVMPTNLYGPNDNFDLEKSHVLPALIRKVYLAKCLMDNDFVLLRQDIEKRGIATISPLSSNDEIVTGLTKYGICSDRVKLWGTGKPLREFMWSEDMADACVYIMENVDFKDLLADKEDIRNCHINIGTGNEISISALANIIKEVVGYDGTIEFNPDMPDGTLRKLTDVSKLNALGWKYKTDVPEGVRLLYHWYTSH